MRGYISPIRHNFLNTCAYIMRDFSLEIPDHLSLNFLSFKFKDLSIFAKDTNHIVIWFLVSLISQNVYYCIVHDVVINPKFLDDVESRNNIVVSNQECCIDECCCCKYLHKILDLSVLDFKPVLFSKLKFLGNINSNSWIPFNVNFLDLLNTVDFLFKKETCKVRVDIRIMTLGYLCESEIPI